MKRYHLTLTAYWQDAISWTPDEKSLGIYLQTCSHRTSTEGLYRLLLQYAAIETGWTVERVTETIDLLVGRGWLGWDPEHNIVLLRCALEDLQPKGDRQIKGAASAVAQIPRSSPLWPDFVTLAERHCPELARLLEPSTASPSGPHPERNPTPSDTPSIPDRTRTEGVSEDSSDSHSHSSSSSSGGGERASADEPVDSSDVTPLHWAQATAALANAGIDRRAIEVHRTALAAELTANPRTIEWPAAGRWLGAKRRAGDCSAAADQPVAALRFVLLSPSAPVPGGRRRPGQRNPQGAQPENTLSDAAAADLMARIMTDARQHIGDDRWDTWLSVIRFAALSEGDLWLAAPDHARADIEHRLMPLLRASAERVLDRPMTARLVGGRVFAPERRAVSA